jgi:hypothetical protein
MKKRQILTEKRIDLTNLTYYVQPKRTLNPDPTPASNLMLEFRYLSQTLENDDILKIEYWLADNKRDNFKRYNKFIFLTPIEKLGNKFEDMFLSLKKFERKDFLFMLCDHYNIN